MFQYIRHLLSRDTQPTNIPSECKTELQDDPVSFLEHIQSGAYSSTFIQDARSTNTDSLLHLAIYYANRNKNEPGLYEAYQDVLKALLSKGANLNYQNHRGFTPLMYAVRFLLPDIVEDFLQNHECDLSLTSEKDHTARAMLDDYVDNPRANALKTQLDSHVHKVQKQP